ncbi:MAG: MBL fold metallo-hydrolase [Anaerolineae bacterium]|jgi:glyoxylase-like metal-dependent hydrolase (beta-lactamase superfamily II)|nr:MBL fold metallo-hydrolase [Anaerolineae bacterium]
MTDLPPVTCYHASNGARLYRLPAVVFPPGFVGYSYVVLEAGVPTLIDTGSGFGRSTDDLLAGLAALRDDFGERLRVTDIERILITHGHVDHFGGLAHLLEATGGARVGVHPLDKRVLTNYEERVVVATRNLTIYLRRAGVREERLAGLLEMYGFSKKHVRSIQVDLLLEEGTALDGMQFYHVPGHCSGQVAILIGDILLSADHILPRTSPHLAAESITHYTGVGHYRESLHKIARLPGIRLTLGGHEEPIDDVYARIATLQERLTLKQERILDILRSAPQPLSISDISKALYIDKHGFDVLLALQEAGAHVEYLYDRGYLAIANLSEFEQDDHAALLYTVL